MDITEEIILDLLPLYYEGNASEDTTQLIEKYFIENPQFAKIMNSVQKRNNFKLEKNLYKTPLMDQELDEEMILLNKTKKLLRIRSCLLIVAIISLIWPIMSVIVFGQTAWGALALLAFVSPLSWIGYYILKFKMRVSRL